MASKAPNFEIRGSQFLQDQFQQALSHWNRDRLMPTMPDDDWMDRLDRDHRMMRLEGRFMEELRAEVREEAAAAPTDAEGFVAWLEALKVDGPGQGDPFFPWLRDHAEREQICWFLRQEAAGEAGFDDLVAYTQVKLPARAKLDWRVIIGTKWGAAISRVCTGRCWQSWWKCWTSIRRSRRRCGKVWRWPTR